MLIRLYSDTHLETGKGIIIPPMELDMETVLVLAGDIGYPKDVINLIAELTNKFLAIIYITGNHEYYDRLSDKDEIDNIIEAGLEEFTNVYFLSNSSVKIQDVTFIGSTLWADITSSLNKMGNIYHQLNDFRMIYYFGEDSEYPQPLTYAEMANWQKESVKYLENTINRTEGKKVIVTHFSPSTRSTHIKYLGNKLNPYFHNNLEYLLVDNELTWLHGHTHASCDYTIGNSKVFCNPWGYYDIRVENPEFNEYLTIEV